MHTPDNQVTFSVIVPVYQHWHLVARLLSCLGQQTLPQQAFEVILVDNGSSEINIPLELADNVFVVHCATPGSYAARNVGLNKAKGLWLAFTDADCLPEPGWLQRYARHIDDAANRPGLLTGPVEMVLDAVKPNAYQIYDSVKGIPQYRYYKRGYAATANLVASRELIESVGGFDAQRFSGGDAAFCRKAARHGVSLEWVDEATVGHPARCSWDEVASKARRIKGGQIASGTPSRRLYWLFRSLIPPFMEIYNLMGNQRYSRKMRLTACLVQIKLWGVSLGAIIDFIRFKKVER